MSVQHPKFRAAAVQAAPVFLDLDATIDKSIALIAEASENGAGLIAFPETFVPGYPWFIWLDSPAWGMQFIQRYHDNSLVYGSPQAGRLAKAAGDYGITVVMGHSEKHQGSLYMAQWIIGRTARRSPSAASSSRPTSNGPSSGKATAATWPFTTPRLGG
jgi:aliphatic nitrilase